MYVTVKKFRFHEARNPPLDVRLFDSTFITLIKLVSFQKATQCGGMRCRF